MTNYEEITGMSIRELAKLLNYFNAEETICNRANPSRSISFCRLHRCVDCAIDWLKQEVKK